MANPSPPPASYGNMSTRAGYSDGTVLTTSELDSAANLMVQQDGSQNVQQILTMRLGGGSGGGASASGFLCADTNSSLWLVRNAYTVDGTNWYPFVESAPSSGILVSCGNSGYLGQTNNVVYAVYSPALNGDGPITWQLFALSPFTSLTRWTVDEDEVVSPVVAITTMRDKATLTADRKATLNNPVGTGPGAGGGWTVRISRRGSSGAKNRKVYQADGTTLITQIPDNSYQDFTFDDAGGGLWYPAATGTCT